jgi:glycosyltransferase involved in cell wall biosynthesis
LKISAALITQDAAEHLERCLKSLDFVDEIVVVDQGSRDSTRQICEAQGAHVHLREEFPGFGPLKRAAVDLCSHDWVLSIDSDEEVTPELRQAILDLKQSVAATGQEPAEAAFAVNRLSRFLGRWIRHGGWHPDYVVRFFDRRRARFNERQVHEAVQADGPVGRLNGLLLHYTYESMEQYLEKLNRYTSLAAEDAVTQGKRTSLPMALIRAKLMFVRMWALKGGWRDGWEGLLLSFCSSFYVLTKYVKIWWMVRK